LDSLADAAHVHVGLNDDVQVYAHRIVRYSNLHTTASSYPSQQPIYVARPNLVAHLCHPFY
jgi:hypothetical protein